MLKEWNKKFKRATNRCRWDRADLRCRVLLWLDSWTQHSFVDFCSTLWQYTCSKFLEIKKEFSISSSWNQFVNTVAWSFHGRLALFGAIVTDTIAWSLRKAKSKNLVTWLSWMRFFPARICMLHGDLLTKSRNITGHWDATVKIRMRTKLIKLMACCCSSLGTGESRLIRKRNTKYNSLELSEFEFYQHQQPWSGDWWFYILLPCPCTGGFRLIRVWIIQIPLFNSKS